ncbi:MAG: Cys-tRNA(Pro) deacylase [Thermovirgaceae bacterium]|nr:Cys-tRNA(Pro) deacylase [Thermovirgaceae bacterium]
MKKTNAARILESIGVDFELWNYEVDPSDVSAKAVAAKIGLPLGQIFKTLVARGDKTGVILACVPGDAELDLKALASASGNKKTELVPMKEVLPLTGYIRGGVSPLGTKKAYPVYIDESAFTFDRICVSAGARGVQVFLDPEGLSRAVGAVPAPISKPD